MYLLHKKKKLIYFWLKCVKLNSRKSTSDPSGNTPQNKRQATLVEMMVGVDT